MNKFHFLALSVLISIASAKAEFLFTGTPDFIIPTISGPDARYSEWRNFYATSTAGNLPDYYAEFGGVESGGLWYPTARPENNPAFPGSPYYTTPNPNAFWDVSNPTITQTNQETGRITAGGNFYSLDGPQSFRLDDNTMATSDAEQSPGYEAGTVIFQFQTDGLSVDLSQVRLGYTINGVTSYIYANDLSRADYLREFQLSEGASTDPSAAEGYANRTAIQWDLTGLGVTEYWIDWNTEAHTSFQQAALDTSKTYVPGIPTSRAWTGGSGVWSEGNNWFTSGQNSGYGSAPVANGNVRFSNSSAAAIDLTGSQTVGEIVFGSASDVEIYSSNGAVLTSNTGISTTSNATGIYTISADYALGALNFFSINAGTVVMEGVVSGSYSLVKQGEGQLTLVNNNTLSGFIDVQGGVLRIEGSNAFLAGPTLVRGGNLIIAADQALGNSTVVKIGYNSDFFETETPAGLTIEGARTFDQNIQFVSNNSLSVIAAKLTDVDEAVFSGNVQLAQGNSDIRFRAEAATDTMRFTGNITDGGINRTVTLDGLGTVIFSGAAKNYNSATVINNGTLILDTTIGAAQGSGFGQFTVKNGAVLHLTSNGRLRGYAGDFATPASLLTIENGGTLSGSGWVERGVKTSGSLSTISAGESAGTLRLASLDAALGVKFVFELGSVSDFVQIDGLLTGSSGEGMMKFQFLDAGDIETGVAYSLLSFGSASGLSEEDFALFEGSGFVLDENYGVGGWLIDGNIVKVQFSAIPEPSTYALLILGAIFAFWAFKRRQKISSH